MGVLAPGSVHTWTRMVSLRGSTPGRCRPVREDWAWPVSHDWFLTCVLVGDQHTGDSLTGNWFLSNHMVWAHIGSLQQQMRITLQNEDDSEYARNITRFYSRVRTLATRRFCSCASLTGVRFICTAKYLGQAKCVHKVTTDFTLTLKRQGLFLLAGLGYTHRHQLAYTGLLFLRIFLLCV
jgi:hypothetical protein